MMDWVGSGEVGLGPEILGWVGLVFEKVTHDQLCTRDSVVSQVRAEMDC